LRQKKTAPGIRAVSFPVQCSSIMPTRLADGLGFGSILFPFGKYAPDFGSPAFTLLCESRLHLTNCQLRGSVTNQLYIYFETLKNIFLNPNYSIENCLSLISNCWTVILRSVTTKNLLQW